tara:strand:+ start:251 stop:1066 length:816 start_codon:yes stop_codon:yes gene_type:complete
MKLSLKILREAILQEIILESTAPDESVASAIYQAIIDSKFWEMAHNENDVDLVDKATWSTPAIETLMDALNASASNLGTDLYFLLSVTDDELYTLGPNDEYNGYPNNWMMRGQYRGPERGKHIVWLEFRPYSDEYSMDDLDSTELSKIISRTINHELVHYNQLKKQAESKGISEEEAWEELMNDPKQLSKSGTQEDYLSLHNEIDAFAYEAAEQLLDTHTPDEALALIKRQDSDLTGIVGRYRKTLKDDRKSLEKFLVKLYTNIKKMESGS